MFNKQILGVHKKTTTIGVLLELGKTPIHLEAVKFAIKNWERIKQNSGNELLCLSYQDAIKHSLMCVTSIRELLNKNGMLTFFMEIPPSNKYFIHKRLYQVLVDNFHQNALCEIQRVDSKLHYYSKFKTVCGTEQYMNKVNNMQHRIALSRFRLSCHKLNIEIGRYTRIPREERYCPFCPNSVEDENHFLFKCAQYTVERNLLLQTVQSITPSFQFYTQEIKLTYLMTREETINQVAKFIFKAFEDRERFHPLR